MYGPSSAEREDGERSRYFLSYGLQNINQSHHQDPNIAEKKLYKPSFDVRRQKTRFSPPRYRYYCPFMKI